jgi:hypothetical protein
VLDRNRAQSQGCIRNVPMLKEPYPCYSGRTSPDAGGGIFDRDATDGEHRKSAAGARQSKVFEASGVGDAIFLKNGSEQSAICAVPVCEVDLGRMVARYCDGRIANPTLKQNRTCIGGREIVGTQMHSIRFTGDGYVNARVDQQTRALLSRAHNFGRTSSQIDEIARSEILFPNLDHVNPGLDCSRNAVEQEALSFVLAG